MNLQKLFEVQAGLDFHINKNHPVREDEDRLAEKILALQVELGELANEWRVFKFWSNDREPRTNVKVKCPTCKGNGMVPMGKNIRGLKICPDCRRKGNSLKTINPLLEEYVDCLHFILSIGLELAYKYTPVSGIYSQDISVQFIELNYKSSELYFSIEESSVNAPYIRDIYQDLFDSFLALGTKLGFTWEQIEQAYLEKNKINHERQLTNY